MTCRDRIRAYSLLQTFVGHLQVSLFPRSGVSPEVANLLNRKKELE